MREEAATAPELLFCEWLRENGASFNKIAWPSSQTDSGVRGAIALEDIETNEHMVIIPEKLMLTPVAAESSEIGPLLQAESSHLRGDDTLTMFLLHELAKGPASFYHPYLSILPEPVTILHWTEPELAQLQDAKLLARVGLRMSHLKSSYERVVGHMSSRYPHVFDLEDEENYGFDRYLFALLTIQARAFGRRLPWSALVPMADCLNHGNVQTKYDFNEDGNGLFRLFPTGENRYAAGREVYNSYGRRNNAHLLLDYGFAILENEWDVVELDLAPLLLAPTPLSLSQRTLLHRASIPRTGVIVSSRQLCWDALTWLRVSSWDEETVEHAARERLDVHRPGSQEEETAAMDAFHDAIDRALARYPTTIDHDRAALRSAQEEEGRASLALAVTYRLTRKLVLLRQRRLVADVLRVAKAVIRRSAEVPGPPLTTSWLREQLGPEHVLLDGEPDRIAAYLRGLAYLPATRPQPPPLPKQEAEATGGRDSPDIMVKIPPPLAVDNVGDGRSSRAAAWAEA